MTYFELEYLALVIFVILFVLVTLTSSSSKLNITKFHKLYINFLLILAVQNFLNPKVQASECMEVINNSISIDDIKKAKSKDEIKKYIEEHVYKLSNEEVLNMDAKFIRKIGTISHKVFNVLAYLKQKSLLTKKLKKLNLTDGEIKRYMMLFTDSHSFMLAPTVYDRIVTIGMYDISINEEKEFKLRIVGRSNKSSYYYRSGHWWSSDSFIFQDLPQNFWSLIARKGSDGKLRFFVRSYSPFSNNAYDEVEIKVFERYVTERRSLEFIQISPPPTDSYISINKARKSFVTIAVTPGESEKEQNKSLPLEMQGDYPGVSVPEDSFNEYKDLRFYF